MPNPEVGWSQCNRSMGVSLRMPNPQDLPPAQESSGESSDGDGVDAGDGGGRAALGRERLARVPTAGELAHDANERARADYEEYGDDGQVSRQGGVRASGCGASARASMAIAREPV